MEGNERNSGLYPLRKNNNTRKSINIIFYI